jgi:ATP-dependent DNA helicase RecG
MKPNRLLESETLELKRQFPSNEKLAIEMIALANTKGGQIIIGYDESTKKAVGCEVNQKNEELIANIVSDLTTPRIDYSLSYETIGKATLLIINISLGINKPYYLTNKNPITGTYIRIGSTSRLADRETLTRLIREGKNLPFDSVSVSAKIELDQKLLKDFFDRRKNKLGAHLPKINNAQLESLGLISNSTITVAGALLFCKAPQDIKELSNSYIKAGRFKGNKKGQFIDQRTILGSLPEQIDEAVGFVLRHVNVAGKVMGIKRHDLPTYPVEILREVITNAVIHRDYSISGSSIMLSIYDDRLEIISPGGLPGQVTVENMIDRQYSRNPTISKRMFEMGFFDSWGQGIDKIVSWAKESHLKAPIFLDGGIGGQFLATIFNERLSAPILGKREIENEAKIIALIQASGSISNKEVRDQLGYTKTQAQVALRRLLESGKIKLAGKGRSAKYIF